MVKSMIKVNHFPLSLSLKLFIWLASAVLILTFALLANIEKLTNSIPYAYSAQADYYLKIKGIEGELTDPRYPQAIEVYSWSWGESNSSSGISRGKGSGKANFSSFNFRTKIDKATPTLMTSCASGKKYPEATLFVRQAGSSEEYLIIKLSDVVITSYSVMGSGTDLPTNQFSLSFSKVEFEYKPQSSSSSLGEPTKPIRGGWNVITHKPI